MAGAESDCAFLDHCHYSGALEFKHPQITVTRMASARRTDLVLLTVTLLLVMIGLAMVYSTSAVVAQERYNDALYFLKRQLLWAGVGLFAMWGARYLPYRLQERLTIVLLLGVLVALICVLLFGKTVGGAKRWLYLWSLTMQPSEIAKYVVILYIARTLGHHQERVTSFTDGYLPNILIVALCTLLIFAQPDLGTALILAVTASLLLLVAGVPMRYLGWSAVAGLPLLYWALAHVQFRLDRLLTYFNAGGDPQGSGYQAAQATLALGQGGFLGHGLGQSNRKLFFLPEAHTDFIFAVIGEELGFIGAVTLILLFLILLWRVLRIALACHEPFGTLLGLGIFMLLAMQILINLGVVLSLLPTKGLPLPFVSLGGSNLVVSLVAVGTMLNMAEAESRFV
jgi:cell division protein FtsW